MKITHLLLVLFYSNLLFSQSLSINSVTLENPCFLANIGSITLSVDGGIAPYFYNWSTGASGEDLNLIYSLNAGNFSVTVTDNAGATVDTLVVLSEIDLEYWSFSQDVSCYGFQDGQISVDLYEGVSPFQYYLYQGSTNLVTSAPMVDSVFQFNSLASGTYDIVVSDYRGCTSSVESQIFEPSEVIVELGDDISIMAGQSIDLEAIANVMIDSISWYPGYNISCTDCLTPTVSPLIDTCYLVEIWDQNQCSATDQVCIQVGVPSGINDHEDTMCEIYPTLFNNYLFIDFDDSDDYTIFIYDSNGRQVFNRETTDDVRISTEQFDRGVFYVKIESAQKTSSVVVFKLED